MRLFLALTLVLANNLAVTTSFFLPAPFLPATSPRFAPSNNLPSVTNTALSMRKFVDLDIEPDDDYGWYIVQCIAGKFVMFVMSAHDG